MLQLQAVQRRTSEKMRQVLIGSDKKYQETEKFTLQQIVSSHGYRFGTRVLSSKTAYISSPAHRIQIPGCYFKIQNVKVYLYDKKNPRKRYLYLRPCVLLLYTQRYDLNTA